MRSTRVTAAHTGVRAHPAVDCCRQRTTDGTLTCRRLHRSPAPRRYSLTDQGYGLRGNNITLVVNWNTVPSTGLLTLSHEHQSVYRFAVPEEYSSS